MLFWKILFVKITNLLSFQIFRLTNKIFKNNNLNRSKENLQVSYLKKLIPICEKHSLIINFFIDNSFSIQLCQYSLCERFMVFIASNLQSNYTPWYFCKRNVWIMNALSPILYIFFFIVTRNLRAFCMQFT